MSEAVAVLEVGEPSRHVLAGEWLSLEVCGAPQVLDAVIREQPGILRFAAACSPHAKVIIEPSQPRGPRWPEHALTHSVVEWDGERGTARMQCSEADLRWSGTAEDVLEMDLRIDPDDARSFETALKLLTVLLGVVQRRRLLIHASAVLLDGQAVLFLGDSDAGKSTTAERLLAEGLTRIADDALFVELGDEVRAFPYFGDNAFQAGGGWPVARALQLHKAAPLSEVTAAKSRSLQLWLASLMVPTGPAPYTNAVVDLVSTLAPRRVDTLRAAAAGPLLPALVGAPG